MKLRDLAVIFSHLYKFVIFILYIVRYINGLFPNAKLTINLNAIKLIFLIEGIRIFGNVILMIM